MKPVLATLLLAALTACTSTTPVRTVSDGSGVPTISTSKFDDGAMVEMPPIRERILKREGSMRNLALYDNQVRLLRGKRVAGKPEWMQVYVDIDYEETTWRHYTSASLVGGKRVPVVVVERDVVRCGGYSLCYFREVVAVMVSEETLRGSGDFEVRLNARSGVQDVIAFPRAYVNDFLKTMGL